MDIDQIEIKDRHGEVLVILKECTDYMSIEVSPDTTREIQLLSPGRGYFVHRVTRGELEEFAIKLLSSLGYKIRDNNGD